ncbi:MAG: hypothetical protein AAF433_07240 [Bacteroidota bacterium]
MRITAFLLAALILVQSVQLGLTSGWYNLANDSFTELLCQNRIFELAPRCFGSCQIEDLFESSTKEESSEDFIQAGKRTYLLHCLLPELPSPSSLVKLMVFSSLSPAGEVNLLGRAYRLRLLRPPTYWS